MTTPTITAFWRDYLKRQRAARRSGFPIENHLIPPTQRVPAKKGKGSYKRQKGVGDNGET